MARADGIELKGCVNCIRFRFSGMSYQMSGGRRGYCSLVGFRDPRGLVEIDFVCGEQTPVPGWPDDLAAAQEARIELAEREPRPSRLNAFEGCILGLAIGDALGLAAESLARDQIPAAFGPEGITDSTTPDDPSWSRQLAGVGPDYPAWTHGEYTRMSMAVAEALLEANREDMNSIRTVIANHRARWLQAPENERSPGETSAEDRASMEVRRPGRESGAVDPKDRAGAVRVEPIGLLCFRDHTKLLEVARTSALLTHRHDAAVESAVAVALLVALALQKRSPQAMYDALNSECAPRSPDFRACLEKLPGLLHADPVVALSRHGIGEGWVAEEAVVSALYCFWRSPADSERTVLTAVNTDGDSESIATITGSISGAFNGAEEIPRRWRENVENSESLKSLAARLWEASL
jgi:ADP-ribosylglycohydrolase